LIYYLFRGIDEECQLVTDNLISTTVERLYLKYINDDCLIIVDGSLPYNQNNEEFINSFIDKIPNLKYIIVDTAGNPIDVEQTLNEFNTYNLKKPFYILTGNFNYFKKSHIETKVKFFPFWTVWSSVQHKNVSLFAKRYNLSCLNGTPSFHKRLLYIALSKEQYFSDILFSFGSQKSNVYYAVGSDILIDESEELEYSKLPYPVEIDIVDIVDLSTNQPAYQQTYINIVTETTCTFRMLSEKTFKPIRAGQLFILLAPVGSIQFLRDIGIDTFDDIVDHSYDTVDDIRLRIKLIVSEISRLNLLQLDNIYSIIKPRLIQNAEFLNSDKFRDQFLPLTFNEN
jgi:hypothetical protein